MTQNASPRSRTKIIATIGPACDTEEKLTELVAAGVDIFRLNTAHSDNTVLSRRVEQIRSISKKLGQPLGILVDLGGPKIRLGQLAQEPLECVEGAKFDLVRGETSNSPHELTSNYAPLIDELTVGDRVMLADGTVGMRVVDKSSSKVSLVVTAPGIVRSRQGINLPGAKLSVVSPTEEDLVDTAWAAEHDIDFIGLSFVRSADEVRMLRAVLAVHRSKAMVIAKIEKPEALAELESIVAAADGVMVARGDLGVEIDVAEMAIVQKRIISMCKAMRKPVIVATQMLESMRSSRSPTRAEATDVANAILDGADACMLSGETAVGDFPRETVAMMNRIACSIEPLVADQPPLALVPRAKDTVLPMTLAVVHGGGEMANMLGAKLVVIETRTGATAVVRAKQRNLTPTIAVSKDENTLRKMTLLWGIMPMADAPVADLAALTRFIDEWGIAQGLLQKGDYVVHINGTAIAHDQVTVHQVP
jgi:pyruvate kinase